jgi:CheY-like chemotaxis protein
VNQKVTLKQLENLGYMADVAANGQEALQMTAQIPYDLILMDCQMPVLDGYSATQEIRRIEQGTRHTVIIALTANAMKEDRQRCLDAGMDDYLSKPVLKDQLASKLQEWETVALVARRTQTHKEPHYPQLKVPSLSDASPPAIDWEHLHQLSDGSEEFELELLQMYSQDSRSHLEEMEQAITQGDCAHLEQVAHYIKGASANVGMVEMHTIACQLEQLARQQQLEGAVGLMDQLVRSLEMLRAYLIDKEYCPVDD